MEDHHRPDADDIFTVGRRLVEQFARNAERVAADLLGEPEADRAPRSDVGAEERIAELSRQNADLTQALHEAQVTIADLNQKLDGTAQARDGYQRVLRDAEARLQVLEDRHVALDDRDVPCYRGEPLQSVWEERNALQARVRAVQQDLTRVGRERDLVIDARDKAVRHMQDALDSRTEAHEAHRAERDQLLQEFEVRRRGLIDGHQQQMQAKDDALDECERQRDELRGALEQLGGAIDRVAWSGHIRPLSRCTHCGQTIYQDTDGEWLALDSSCYDSVESPAVHEPQQADLKARRELRDAHEASATDDLRTAREQSKDHKIEDLRESLGQALTEADRWQARADELQRQYDAARDTLDRRQAEIEHLARRLHDITALTDDWTETERRAAVAASRILDPDGYRGEAPEFEADAELVAQAYRAQRYQTMRDEGEALFGDGDETESILADDETMDAIAEARAEFEAKRDRAYPMPVSGVARAWSYGFEREPAEGGAPEVPPPPSVTGKDTPPPTLLRVVCWACDGRGWQEGPSSLRDACPECDGEGTHRLVVESRRYGRGCWYCGRVQKAPPAEAPMPEAPTNETPHEEAPSHEAPGAFDPRHGADPDGLHDAY